MDMKARIEARRWAEECYGCVEDKVAFAERVDELHNGIPEPAPKMVRMTNGECADFEGSVMWFGQYVGKTIGEVPLSYLQRLVDPPSGKMKEWMAECRRYLANPTIAMHARNE